MEQELLSRLYNLYRKELYLYLYAFCKNREQAEDLLQETFLKAILSLPAVHTNMRAWLYVVARNLFFNQQKQKKPDSLDESHLSIPSEEQLPIDKLIANEEKKVLYRSMLLLDERKREILNLQYFSGLSQKEIASILHITPENVRILAFRAKKELKTIMEEQDYDLS